MSGSKFGRATTARRSLRPALQALEGRVAPSTAMPLSYTVSSPPVAGSSYTTTTMVEPTHATTVPFRV